MKILNGLMAGQVLQRLGKKGAALHLTGTARTNGPILASVLQKGKPLAQWKQRTVGRGIRGRFLVVLKNLPVGGPYDLRLENEAECVEVRGWFVGDVWLLAGQSNMQGWGQLHEAAKPHPMVRAFYMDRHWDLAKDPLHVLGESPDPVHYGQDIRGPAARKMVVQMKKGAGLGIFFGTEMFKRSGGVPQGLVCTAQGGTCMKQWDPALKKQGGHSLYGSMLATLRATGQPIAGMLWYQGESDADPNAMEHYFARTKSLIAAVRRDLHQPKLPWFMVQIGRTINREAKPWHAIQEAQRLLKKEVANLHLVAAVDLTLLDGIHLRTHDGLDRIARRLARLADREYLGNRRELPPPELAGIACRHGNRKGVRVVEVSFRNVVGKLRCEGKPWAFATVNEEGKAAPLIYDAVLQKNRVLLKLKSAPTSQHSLVYGMTTTMPTSLLRDARDMPVPVFGPIPLCKPTANTPFVVCWKVSSILPKTQKLDRLTLSNFAALPLTKKDFSHPAGFVDMHEIWSKEKGLTFFFTEIDCPEAMLVEACMDYDAPFRLWVDGRSFFTDMRGTNPCIPDEIIRPLRLTKGRHRVAVAMDSSGVDAWGFFLRFRRKQTGIEPVMLPVF